jgi:mono/diheme cytochrome c family protein
MKRIAQQLILIAAVSLLFIVLAGASPLSSPVVQNANSSKGASDLATIFKSKCSTCHGKDGRAKTFKAKFNGARNLANADWQESVTDERIFNSISNGRGKMPAFGEKLSQVQIEGLVNYVRVLKK